VALFACGNCGAALAFDGVRTLTCPYCASPNFAEREPAAGVPDPRFVVGFIGDAEVARRAIDRWLGSRSWFADPALRRATVEDLRGVYVPAYLYSAVAHTSYSAQIGEHYSEEETYTVTGADGKTRTETRTVTRTEYRSLAGTHVGYVTDVVVSASGGLENAELARVEPFDLRQMRRFQPALVAGWIAEEFSRPLAECQQASRAEALEQIGGKLRRFMPGDSYSDLAWRTNVAWESMEPVLVPAWVLALRYRPNKPALRVVINGQTGKIVGRAPLSWWKITLAIAVVVAIVAAIVWGMR
jgi:hypothetical protein